MGTGCELRGGDLERRFRGREGHGLLSAVISTSPQYRSWFIHKHIGLVRSISTTTPSEAVSPKALNEARDGRELGYLEERARHEAAWADIWSLGDIRIEGDVEAQQAIRFNIFHLNQTYRGDDARLNVGPKGFTGEKYGGASYWDTEAYCLPFFLATHPEHVAEQLLRVPAQPAWTGPSKMPESWDSPTAPPCTPWSP